MSQTIDTRLDRAQGCLLGQLTGDTLGGLVEFSRPEAIRSKYPGGVREMQSGGTWRNIAGQPTDDSEMALALARMLVRKGKYDQADALEAYLAWFPHAWDRGGTISQALQAASAGKSPEDRLQKINLFANNNSQANGSLMRCSPLGIFGAGRPTVTEWARLDSSLTHPHNVCIASCAVFVTTIAFAIETGADRYAVHRFAVDLAGREKVPEVIGAAEASKTRPPSDYVSQMGWVLIALQNAFYQLQTAATVEDGIADTISRGGDTDTNAAIVGALLGAVHGRKGIPERWIKTLQECRPDSASGSAHPMPQDYWPCDVLELAGQLLVAGGKTVSEEPPEPTPEESKGSSAEVKKGHRKPGAEKR